MPSPVAPGLYAHFSTSLGDFTARLFEQEAPNTVANFVGLAEGTKEFTDPKSGAKAKRPFFDGLVFHRVIPEFMIQGGDPAGDGSGDAGYYLKDEIDPALTFSVPGRLAMANSGPDTNGSQFFITEQAFSDLNGKYTIFGQCDAPSVQLVMAIARVPRNKDDKPLTPIYINRVTIVRDGQPMPPVPSAAPTVSTAPPAPVAP